MGEGGWVVTIQRIFGCAAMLLSFGHKNPKRAQKSSGLLVPRAGQKIIQGVGGLGYDGMKVTRGGFDGDMPHQLAEHIDRLA